MQRKNTGPADGTIFGTNIIFTYCDQEAGRRWPNLKRSFIPKKRKERNTAPRGPSSAQNAAHDTNLKIWIRVRAPLKEKT